MKNDSVSYLRWPLCLVTWALLGIAQVVAWLLLQLPGSAGEHNRRRTLLDKLTDFKRGLRCFGH